MKRIAALVITAALGLSGCAPRVYSDEKGNTWVDVYRAFREDENRLVCRAPREPRRSSQNDPNSGSMDAEELGLYDREAAFLQRCTNQVIETGKAPERPRFTEGLTDRIEENQPEQVRWKEQDAIAAKASAEEEEAELNQIVALQNSGEKVSVHNEHTINNNSSSGDGGLAGRLKKMFDVDVKNAGLNIEEQEQICNGTYSGPAEVMSLGEVEFSDCVCRPKDPTSIGGAEVVANIEANLDSGTTLLYCGNATEHSANKCKDLPPDYGNGELSWDRAERTAMYTCHVIGEKVDGISMAVYPNKTKKGVRKTEVYMVRKVKS